MKKPFEIIIPVTVKHDVARDLLDNLVYNSDFINRIIIIDNSEKGHPFLVFKEYPFQLDIYSEGFRRSCNESWNYGITKLSFDCEYVTILNDDLAIGPWFLSRILNIFQNYPKAGAACPETIQDEQWVKKDKYLNDVPLSANVVRMKKREGGAFTIRKTILDVIPPIPNKLKAFYGDDWFWRWTYKLGFIWMKDDSNKVYHLGGMTNKALGIEHSLYLSEKKIWFDVIEEYGLQRYHNKKVK